MVELGPVPDLELVEKLEGGGGVGNIFKLDSFLIKRDCEEAEEKGFLLPPTVILTGEERSLLESKFEVEGG